MKHLFYLVLIILMLLAFIVGAWMDNPNIVITAFFGALILALIKDWKTIIKAFE